MVYASDLRVIKNCENCANAAGRRVDWLQLLGDVTEVTIVIMVNSTGWSMGWVRLEEMVKIVKTVESGMGNAFENAAKL